MNITADLKEIIQMITDSQLGFAEAAGHISDPNIKGALMRTGNDRALMIEELANELARIGEETPMDGTTNGALHRSWMELKQMISVNDDNGFLEECARGEKRLIQRYTEVIGNEGITEHVRKTLGSHKVKVDSSLKDITQMRQLLHHNEK